MKTKNALIALLGLCLLAGCNPDHSGDTRQVATPNPPVKSPSKDDFIQNNPNIPQAAKDSLAKAIPGPGHGAAAPAPAPTGK